MRSAIKPEISDLKALLVSIFITGIAFTAFYGDITIENTAIIMIFSSLIIISREIGQRITAEWMGAYVNLEKSIEGISTTLLFAIIALLSDSRLIALFPLQSSFEGHKYEHWGKSVDAIWMKRQYWLTSTGILAMLILGFLSWILNLTTLAQMTFLFALFQMLPFNHPLIPTGKLDGAYILMWSGFMWLLLTGTIIIMTGITIFQPI